MSHKIEIVPPYLFRTEANRLMPIFEADMAGIHYLGGITRPEAKPIIHIGVEFQTAVLDDERVKPRPAMTTAMLEALIQKMLRLGYTLKYEQPAQGQYLFTKETDPRATYHVHLYRFGQTRSPVLPPTPANEVITWVLHQVFSHN